MGKLVNWITGIEHGYLWNWVWKDIGYGGMIFSVEALGLSGTMQVIHSLNRPATLKTRLPSTPQIKTTLISYCLLPQRPICTLPFSIHNSLLPVGKIEIIRSHPPGGVVSRSRTPAAPAKVLLNECGKVPPTHCLKSFKPVWLPEAFVNKNPIQPYFIHMEGGWFLVEGAGEVFAAPTVPFLAANCW